MTTEEKQNTLKRIFWEYELQGKELLDILQGKILRAGHIDKDGIYARLLSSLNWYAILDIVDNDRLNEVLSDGVIGRIHSKDLKKKYAIAKRLLFP